MGPSCPYEGTKFPEKLDVSGKTFPKNVPFLRELGAKFKLYTGGTETQKL